MPNTPIRIFALDPSSKGFGYALFETPFRVVEWGFARTSGDKYASAVLHFENLLDRYRPDSVVLEDSEAPGSRRQPRIRRLIEALAKIASDRGFTVSRVSRAAVLKCFSPLDAKATKYSIAERLTKDFPELKDWLPPPRKPWRAEDKRLSVFNALALAITFATA